MFSLSNVYPFTSQAATSNRSADRQTVTQHLVFADARLAEVSVLRAALQPDAELIVVPASDDGFLAIEHALQHHAPRQSSSIHLLGHATSGTLWLGSTAFDRHHLAQHRSQLAEWSTHLAIDGIVAVYGCQFAADAIGLQTVQQLNEALRRPIFAASQRVGSPIAGGTWALNVCCEHGFVAHLHSHDAAIPIGYAFDHDRLSAYTHSFAPPNLLYGVNYIEVENDDNYGEIFTVNLKDGSTELQVKIPSGSFALARSYDPNNLNDNGLLYFTENDSDNNNPIRLGAWDPATNEIQATREIDRDLNDDNIPDIKGNFTRFSQHQDGRLFAFAGRESDLFIINPDTAKAAFFAQMVLEDGNEFPVTSGDIVFDPNDENILYILSAAKDDINTPTEDESAHQIYRANLTNLAGSGDDAKLTAVLVGDVRLGDRADSPLLLPEVTGSFGIGEDSNFYITSRRSGDSYPSLYRIAIEDVDATEQDAGDTTLKAEWVEEMDRPVSDFASFPTPTVQIDLQVSKISEDSNVTDPFQVGDSIIYTITVTNPTTPRTGLVAFPIEGVKVTDNVSPHLDNVQWSAEFTEGTGRFLEGENMGTGSVNSMVDLGVGAIVTYTVTGIIGPGALGTLSNTAEVELPPGFNFPNDETEIISGTDETEVQPGEVDVVVSQRDIPATVEPGETIEFEITVLNSSNLAIDGVNIRDEFPGDLENVVWERTLADGTIERGEGHLLNATIDLEANESVVYRVTAKVSADATHNLALTNTVTATLSSSAYADSDTTNNSAEVGTIVEVDTTEPVDPVEPVDPIDPTDPVEPTDPAEPIDPTDPVEPIDPIDPTPVTPAPIETPNQPASERASLVLNIPLSVAVSIDTVTPFADLDLGLSLDDILVQLWSNLEDTGAIDSRIAQDPDAGNFLHGALCSQAPQLEPIVPELIVPALPEILTTEHEWTGDNSASNVYGDDRNERLQGLAGDDILRGFGGMDILLGNGEQENDTAPNNDRDWLTGNQGNDIIAGNRGSDTMFGGQGSDWVFGGQEGDLVWGDRGDDRIFGERGSDTLSGDSGDPAITSGAGSDWIDGGSGNDVLFGNAETDTLLGGVGDDLIWGGRDRDLLLGSDGDDGLSGDRGDDSLGGGAGDDTLAGRSGRDRLDGNTGDDILQGGLESDTLDGGIGNDTLDGGTSDQLNIDTSDDFLFGGAGSDLMLGSQGDDSLVGGEDDDTLHGGRQDDHLWGETGDDLILGGLDADHLCGDRGDDTLVGGTGWSSESNDAADTLAGGEGDDLGVGNRGDDLMLGDRGDDTLLGGRDSDTLLGGAGDDWLSGDRGDDLLLGGDGADYFVINPVTGHTTIADFEATGDVLVFVGIESSAVSLAAIGDDVAITINGVQRGLVLDATTFNLASRTAFESLG